MIDFGDSGPLKRIRKSPGLGLLLAFAAGFEWTGLNPAPALGATAAANAPSSLTQVQVRLLELAGSTAGSRLRWKLDVRAEGGAERVASQLGPGKLALLVQGAASRASIRVESLDSKTLEGQGVLLKDAPNSNFQVGQAATLAYRMSAASLEESKQLRKKRAAWDHLGTWAFYAGYSGLGYSEDFRPNLSASYLALSAWGDWLLDEKGRFSIRTEISTEALPLESQLDQAVSGEQATLARFVRGSVSFSALVLRFGEAWKILARPGFSFATMLISNPQFGYFNMTGPSLFLSLQDVPRIGRKLYLDAGAELLNVTPFAFDLSSLGLSVRAGGSITPLGFGELDAYLKYRAVALEIDSIQISENAFEVGLGYRW